MLLETVESHGHFNLVKVRVDALGLLLDCKVVWKYGC